MNQDNGSEWGAHAGTSNDLGLGMQDEDFADILNPEIFGDFGHFNALDSDNRIERHSPFGNSLSLPTNADDELSRTLQYFDAHSRPDEVGGGPDGFMRAPASREYPAVDPSIAYNGHEIPQANNVQSDFMRGALPTPNSSEMYGRHGAEFLYQQGTQRGVAPHQRMAPTLATDPNPYTPFESPGMDACQNAVSFAAEYPLPSSYALSPLSSPAMNPQLNHAQTPRSHPHTAASSAVESPASEVDVAIGPDERPRKTRRKTAQPTRQTAPTTRNKKISASRKDSMTLKMPTRNNKGRISSKTTSTAESYAESAVGSAVPTPSGSVASSISPRPSADAVMAPPPKPKDTTSTPTQATTGRTRLRNKSTHPATPTSIMRNKTSTSIDDAKAGSGAGEGADLESPPTSAIESSMEYLALPEAAAPASAPAPASNSASEKDSVTPSEQLTLNLGSNNNSESPRPDSTATSPPELVGTPKPDMKGNRASKKRNSNSQLISPALRPKISPSTKPLLPEGSGMDSQTQALLIASRSNYENIISGNHLPGVSYPADLGTNLSSKRTSHKLAEQGRRNRINDALKEMQTLLPPKFAEKTKDEDNSTSGGNAKTGNKAAAAQAVQSGNSKAATVENAIAYIKHMQVELQARDSEIQKMKKQQNGS